MKGPTMWLLRFSIFVCASGVLLAQEHSYTPADIENGGRLYQGSCVGCHGPTGDALPGFNLFRGQFRRAASDTEIIRIIRNGIPGTPMPPHNFTETQAGTIVAYLRSMAAGPARTAADANLGDATRGKQIFDGKGNCMNCHRVDGVGKRTGPDLTEVGRLRQPAELERSLTEPSADMRAGNRFYQAVTKDGATITGRLLNQDSFTVQLLDTNERLVSLIKSNLKEHGFMKASPMPSYRDKLSAQEIADVVSYLVSLKGTVIR
jgi:putative heme-binding domain-containing protein